MSSCVWRAVHLHAALHRLSCYDMQAAVKYSAQKPVKWRTVADDHRDTTVSDLHVSAVMGLRTVTEAEPGFSFDSLLLRVHHRLFE